MIGRLGKDAEVKQVNGKNVINFALAHSEKYKDAQGQLIEKTTWVDCAKWGDSTAVAAYMKKGGEVYVEGTPEVRQYQAQDGTTRSVIACRVGLIQLIGGAPQQQQGTAAPVQQQAPVQQIQLTQAPVAQQFGGNYSEPPF